ncbi:MAG: hypothetical protein AAGG51_28150 [Cyanobacteria bacterium P01_G01_bin.54]
MSAYPELTLKTLFSPPLSIHTAISVALLSTASILSISSSIQAVTLYAAHPEHADPETVLVASTVDSLANAPTTQAQQRGDRPSYHLQPLGRSTSVLDLVLSELSPDRELIGDHSFLLDVPHVGEVAFVTTKLNPQGATRLRLDWRPSTGENAYYPLPVAEAIPQWILWEVQAIAFGDFNHDGLGPDVIAIADFITGAGPTGSEPFPVTTVYFYQGNNRFTTDIALNRTLEEQQIAAIGAAIPAIKHYFEILDSSP